MRIHLFSLCSLLILVTACEFPRTQTTSPTPPTGEPVELSTQPAPSATPFQPTPLPTFTPTAVPAATGTPDPNLADWTVLVYLDADNNLELAGLLDVNEMEAAGSSPQVNILVQIDRAAGETGTDGDWTDTLRLRIRGDKIIDAITSPVVGQLGEANMGDPDTLTDFITWGMAAYPANRYALILWDHGAGWNGIAFDGEDRLTLPDLTEALAAVGPDKLDLIAFDACLMGQFDVLDAIQPYAKTAVASEALTPGKGWDYTALLRQFYRSSGLDERELAILMANQFTASHSEDDFVTMTAVDLQKLPSLSYQIEQLAALLANNPALTAGAVGDARSGAETYARVYPDQFEQYAAVDLRHFAQILAQRSENELISQSAEGVADSMDSVILANERGQGYKDGGGIAIYFPRQETFYNPEYAKVTNLKNWNDFLLAYHAAGWAGVSPPEISLTTVLREEVNMQQPGYFEFEIAGREIETVSLLAGRYEEDGRLRLFEYDRLIPEPTHLADGSLLPGWRDGVHEDFYVWQPEVTYLFDSAGDGDFVVMWPSNQSQVEDTARLFTVQGRYRRSGADNPFFTNLAFDHRNGRLARVWGWQSDETAAPAEILPQPGDIFQPSRFYQEADGSISRESGPDLIFDEDGQLYFDWRPVPDGEYLFGFQVENRAGRQADAFTNLTVINSTAVPGEKTYFDPYLGFQFDYPENWFAPIYTGTLLYTTNLSNTTRLQITIYPSVDAGTNASTLSQQTIDQFGPVDVLYTDAVPLAGTNGRRTAYGYEDPDEGSRTGLFLAFVKDGTGFVVDVDGLQQEETATIAAVDRMIQSWQFTEAGFGLQPGRWARVDLDAFSVARPSEFVYQEVRGWQRFSRDRLTFVALRTQPASTPEDDVMATLVHDAGAGVVDFEAGDPFTFALGHLLWRRVDFSYKAGDDTDVWGYIMVRTQNGQEIVAWAEAPARLYNDLEPTVFLVMIADMSLDQP